MKKKDREIFRLLRERYPDAACELIHDTPFQLLISTLLSAQTTDVQVNKIMPALYEQYPDVTAWLDFNIPEIEAMIRTIGLYKTKAKNIYNLVRALIDNFGGEVPHTMAELLTLPGVGRKTANVVLNEAFGEETCAVDTHIFRVANRTGLGVGKTPLAVENAVLKATPKSFRRYAHLWLILLGRYTCVARKPKCSLCPVSDHCNYREKLKN